MTHTAEDIDEETKKMQKRMWELLKKITGPMELEDGETITDCETELTLLERKYDYSETEEG